MTDISYLTGSSTSSNTLSLTKIKLLIIGDSCCGKTCLLQRFTQGNYIPTYLPTIGIDFKTKIMEFKNTHYKVQIWDTAGQERFRTITTAYYRGAMGILLVYDVTNRSSFENMRQWLIQIQRHAHQNVQIIIIGNKIDLNTERQVEFVEGKEFADEKKLQFFETSAKTGINVEEAFKTMFEIVCQELEIANTLSNNIPTEFILINQTKKPNTCCKS